MGIRMSQVQVHNGDCLVVMAGMVEDSVDAIVTDPPYGLEFMGKGWDHGIPGVAFWVEALRVAKPGAHLLAFGGTRTFHRLACAIEDAGWEIRDCVMWVYGSGFPKSHNIGNGWGTALKPAWEPIIVARKPLAGTVAENVLRYGTGAMNIDGCRVGTDAGWSYPNGRGGTGCFGKESLSKNLTDAISATKGRWPANLCHDGSDEVVGLFPVTKSGALKPYKEKHENASSYQFNRDKMFFQDANTGSAARFFYCAKASKQDRDEGCEGMEDKSTCYMATANGTGSPSVLIDDQGKERDRFSAIKKNNHPTVKPVALMRWLCRLVTPSNGLILDPFMGSGSTGKAAILEGFRFIGIEKEPEYCEIARARISNANGELFGNINEDVKDEQAQKAEAGGGVLPG